MTATATLAVTLQRVQYSARMSEETPSFTADVHVNGKKVGTATNRGTGGSTDVFPPTLYTTVGADIETLVDDAFSAWLTLREDKRLLAKFAKDYFDRILLIDNKGRARQTKKLVPSDVKRLVSTPEYVATAKARGDTILNLVPYTQAWPLWKAAVYGETTK